MNPVEVLGNRLCQSVPPGTVGIDPISIITILMGIISACTKETARKAMLLADARPNGMVARTIRRMVNDKLPAPLQNQVAIDMVMMATCKAAHDEGIWDVVYQFRDLRLEKVGEESSLSALREFDAPEGDGETHVS